MLRLQWRHSKCGLEWSQSHLLHKDNSNPSNEAHLDHGKLQVLVVAQRSISCRPLQLWGHHQIKWQQKSEVPCLLNHLDVIRVASSATALQKLQIAVVDAIVQQIGAETIGGFWRSQASLHVFQRRDAASTQCISNGRQLMHLQEVRQFSGHTFHGFRKTHTDRGRAFLVTPYCRDKSGDGWEYSAQDTIFLCLLPITTKIKHPLQLTTEANSSMSSKSIWKFETLSHSPCLALNIHSSMFLMHSNKLKHSPCLTTNTYSSMSSMHYNKFWDALSTTNYQHSFLYVLYAHAL